MSPLITVSFVMLLLAPMLTISPADRAVLRVRAGLVGLTMLVWIALLLLSVLLA